MAAEFPDGAMQDYGSIIPKSEVAKELQFQGVPEEQILADVYGVGVLKSQPALDPEAQARVDEPQARAKMDRFIEQARLRGEQRESQERQVELQARILAVLADYTPEEVLAARVVKKGLRADHLKQRLAEGIEQYDQIKSELLAQFVDIDVTLSSIDFTSVVASHFPHLTEHEVQVHVDAIVSQLCHQGDIVYNGSHYNSREWLIAQNFSPEYVARHPYHTVKLQPIDLELAELARSDPNRLTPAEKSVRGLGQVASGELMPNSDS